jgi:Skp family chaperone for outer membrane proteins
MKKIILTVLISSLTIGSLFAQKAQRIAYIDSEYILENMPEYVDAQAKLNEKIQKWQHQLDAKKSELEMMKADLANQKPLLTKELILDKEEDITIKETEFRNLQTQYFGSTGDLFFYRKQLVKPIQDQMYNAIKEIAEQKKYDFVFDKTSDLIMLYSNNAFDISELVLNSISKHKRKDEMDSKRSKAVANQTNSAKLNEEEVVVEEPKSTLADDREATRIAREEQQKAMIAEKMHQREEQKQKVVAQREENLRKREAAKQAALKKKEVGVSTTKITEKKETTSIKKDSLIDIKNIVQDTVQVEKDTLTPQQRIALDKKLKTEAQKKVIEERRLESIKQKEAQQKALKEKREQALKERELQKKKDNN